MDTLLHEIKNLLARIEAKQDLLLEQRASASTSPRRTSRPPVVDPTVDLTRERVEVIEDVFWTIVNAPFTKKRDSYKVPKSILRDHFHPSMEAVVESVLLNQAALRKAFRTIGKGDSAGERPVDRARRALQQSNLVVMTMRQTVLDMKDTQVVFSPGEANRQRKLNQPEVTSWPGWTTTKRAVATPNPTGGFFDIPDDPCGQRVWPEDEAGEVLPKIVLPKSDVLSNPESYEDPHGVVVEPKSDERSTSKFDKGAFAAAFAEEDLGGGDDEPTEEVKPKAEKTFSIDPKKFQK